MATSDIGVCAYCGGPIERARTGRRAIYCSDKCREAAKWERRKAKRYQPGDSMPSTPLPKVVTDEDLASAVVQARAVQRTFDAGSKSAAAPLRPMCGRVADGIGRVLDREGL